MDVCQQWDNLGMELNVGIGTLMAIRTQFRDSSYQLREILKIRLTTSDNTSWKTLTDALKSPRVEEHWLAGSLESKYCLTKDMKACKH